MAASAVLRAAAAAAAAAARRGRAVARPRSFSTRAMVQSRVAWARLSVAAGFTAAAAALAAVRMERAVAVAGAPTERR